MSLESLGWNDFFQNNFNEYVQNNTEYQPARVVCEFKEQYRIKFQDIEALASVSGKFRYLTAAAADYPVVGDWVVVLYDNGSEHAIIHQLLPRKTFFSRKAAGRVTDEQIISANIDTCFIVTSYNYDFNVRRIERYLTLVYESGITPVIIINKSDLCENTTPYMKDVGSVAMGVPVISLSSKSLSGFDQLTQFLSSGKTSTFIGSSGVGKSTIINILAGEVLLKTSDVRNDGRGRHTTTHRELFVLQDKGIVIDNPGMREVQLWADEDSADITFSDIEQLSSRCRFPDCTHTHEPCCAVLKALENDELDKDRYRSYMKQKNELQRLAEYKGLSKKEIQQKRRSHGKRLAKYIRNMKKYGE